MEALELTPPYRLVRARHGWFLVNTSDIYVGQAVAAYGEYGELEYAFMRQVINSTRDMVEVGANVGSHTVALARLASAHGRRLMAVEPQPVLFQNLCANLALNALFNVQAENCACAADTGSLWFAPPDYTAPGNFGGVSMQTTAAAGQRVRCQRLDDLLDSSWDVGFLKIDVEGFEQSVLQGAAHTLARCRPVVYVENDRVDKSRALIETFWAFGYQCWFHIPPLFNHDNFAGQTVNLFDNLASFNMLCLPKEMPHSLADAPVTDAGFHPLVAQADQ
jgi:FkbM family methyltransferase